MTFLQKVRAKWQEHTPATFALLVIDALLARLSGGRAQCVGYVFIVQPLAEGPLHPTPGVAPARPGVEIRPLAADDPLADDLPRPAAVLARRWRQGDLCLAAVVKGELAGTLWLARGAYDEDEVRCRYVLADPARSAWDYDLWVAPRFRGGRVLLRLWEAAARHLVPNGITHSFSRVTMTNTASLATHARLGAREVGRALFLRLGPMQLTLCSLGPRLHLGWRDDSPPVVTMGAVEGGAPLQRGDKRPRVLARPRAQGAAGSPAALVLGLDTHGLAVARALADAGVPTYAMRKDPPLPGVRSNRLIDTFSVPAQDFQRFDDDIVAHLLRARAAMAAAHPRVALIAISDRQVATIGRNLHRLRGAFDIAWAEGAETVLRLQKKSALEDASRAQGLEYPRTVLCEHAEPPPQARDLRYPLILKPVQPLSSFKTLIAQTPEALRDALRQQAHDLPIVVQEYIAGGDECLYFGALMLDRGRVLHGMVGRKVASHPPARGQTTMAQTCTGPEADEVLRLTTQFFAGTGLTGPVSLELKHGPDGRWWVIEPTVGRTDFWALLCIGAGFNQPLMEYQLACGLPVTSPGPLRHCVWYDTERDPLLYLQRCVLERRVWPCGKPPVFPYAGHRDPLPLLRALRAAAAARWRRLPARLRLPRQATRA